MFAGPVYIAARISLVALWCAAAALCFTRRRPGFLACGLLCLLLASFRAFRWNYALGDVARALVRTAVPARLHDPVRAAGLIAAGIVTVFLLGLAARRRDLALLGAAGGALAVGMLVAVESAGLDELLPAAVGRMPGRYVLEFAGVGLALATLLGRRA